MAKTYEEFKAAFQKKGDIAPVGTQQSIYKKALEDQKKKEAEAEKDSGILKGSGLYHDNMEWWEHITAPIGTVAGTVGDVGLGVVQGAANLVEGVVDLGMHGVGAVGGLFGAKDFARSVKDIANQRSVDTMFGNIEDIVGIENASVFGNQTDSVVQGVGQVAGLILTGGVGNAAGLSQGAVSALTMGVTGASSMGSGISEAYEGGATDAEAWAYGAIKGGVDTVTEMFFGGLGKTIKAIGLSKGITNIDDVVARKLSSKISKQFAKNLVELGVKATAEGLEEFLACVGTAAAKKLTYMSEEDFMKLLEDEKLLEQFISGMVVSAIAQSPTLVSSTKGKISLASGTTKNEDSVIDKEYESRLAEAEKNGKKLSAWDKNKLYEKTIADMDKGRISIDTIEKTLGGDDYKAYQKYINAEEKLIRRAKSLKGEFDKLNKLKNSERTGEQTDRLEKLRDLMKHNAKQINKIRNDPNRAKIKETLSNNVKELSKGSRLEASYVERENAKVHFSTGKAKLSDYSDAKRKTYEDVVKKKLLNNQNKTHDIVDFAANAADKLGTPIYFRTTEQLRLMGHKVDGSKRLNGVFTKKGIYINIESSKSLNFIAGHEITHALEGTDYYKKLQSAVFDFAKSKNIFDEKRNQVKEAYKGRSDADINAELTADLVGDLLFSDSDFINHIVSADRNMAQRLYDSIKHLLKLATSGSREERELEKAKWAFEQAFQEQSKNAKNKGEDADLKADIGTAKYSVSDEKTLDKEDEKRYNSFEWTTQNGILTKGQLDNFYSQYSAITEKLDSDKSQVTKSGEIMVAVSDTGNYYSEGIQNMVVYAKGSLGDLQITSIVAINANNETILTKAREEIYDAERKGIPQTTTGIFVRYDASDYGVPLFGSGELLQGARHNVGFGAERGTSGRKAERAVNYRTTKEGHKVYDLTPNETSSKDGVFFDGKRSKVSSSKESAAKQASAAEKASISNANEAPQEYGNYAVYGKDVRVRDKAAEDIAPIGFTPSSVEAIPNDQEEEIEGIASTYAQNYSADGEDIAHVNVGDKEIVNQKGSALNKARTHLLDQYRVIEDLALETGNRELDAKANFIRTSEQRAQRLIGNGAEGVRALTDIRKEVKKSGLTQEFYDYMHHMHNIDRMSLADKGLGANKAVFGDNVTADVSRAKVAEFESKHPQFKRWAREVYDFNNYLRKLLVEGGVISQKTADLWAQIYPHYVPIRREGKKGNAVNVPLDSGRTGINAPIKAAKGGNSNIEDMFQTMAMRAEQTYRAIAKNNFGIELKNTLQSASESGDVTLNEMIDVIGNDDGLVKKGENGSLPTFTVFENGKRVTFEITEDLYEALKPSSDLLSGTSKILNKASKLQRGLLTEYNLAFLVSNAIKDSQDVLMNSQHARKTYAEYGTAVSELFSHTRGKDGKWIKEYLDNGGEGLTHFNPKTKTFEDSDSSWFKKVVGFVPEKISQINNFIERVPRVAEYIASRKMGKSIEGAMLDAARVTTNFAAGGDVTKWANRNGFTFLNASVQGFNQFGRNIREARRKGVGGALTLAAKFAVAGIPALLVNALLWGDDDEYDELSDYVKDNYYIVGKYGDGQFVRIPKGRSLAVIQNAFEQMKNQITGDDEIDIGRFSELIVNNIAPVNPLENNVIAPIMQAHSNTTWYGDELVPQRLQDLPAEEQYDETTDELSKWLGDFFNQSPYKINYMLDQYSGAIGDILLPMTTPKAEAGDSSVLGKLIAPLRDKFTTDSTLKNQNVTDFYDTVDELKKSANSMYSKEEDTLKYKYMSSVNSEISDLYKKKRELQNSNLPDSEKYEAVRKVQREIDDIAKNALDSYNNVSIDGIHATVGDQQYKWNDSEKDPGWKKLDEKQIATQDLFTSALGVSASDYWEYSTDLSDIKSDEDEYGDTISGSRKKKVLEYIGGLDIDLGAKLILYKNEYNGDDNYNEYIVSYLNSKDNLTYSDRLDILKQIGFEVSADGSKVYW